MITVYKLLIYTKRFLHFQNGLHTCCIVSIYANLLYHHTRDHVSPDIGMTMDYIILVTHPPLQIKAVSSYSNYVQWEMLLACKIT